MDKVILKGLEGIKRKKIEAAWIVDVTDISNVLKKGLACTSAGDNGAINIWKDDDGLFRCKAMRYRRTINEQKYRNISDVENWISIWIDAIK